MFSGYRYVAAWPWWTSAAPQPLVQTFLIGLAFAHMDFFMVHARYTALPLAGTDLFKT
jgi:hypothetical protein